MKFDPDTLSYCNADSVLLDAGVGFASYLWNDSSETQQSYVTGSGQYKTTVTDDLGCTATDSVYVSMVTANIGQSDTTICRGG